MFLPRQAEEEFSIKQAILLLYWILCVSIYWKKETFAYPGHREHICWIKSQSDKWFWHHSGDRQINSFLSKVIRYYMLSKALNDLFLTLDSVCSAVCLDQFVGIVSTALKWFQSILPDRSFSALQGHLPADLWGCLRVPCWVPSFFHYAVYISFGVQF